jgi:hypothetical protein
MKILIYFDGIRKRKKKCGKKNTQNEEENENVISRNAGKLKIFIY